MTTEQQLRRELDSMTQKLSVLQRIAEERRVRIEELERNLRIYRAQLSKSTLRRLEEQVGCFGCESGWSAAYYHTCKKEVK